jgi:peroxiredoxin
MLEAGKPAPAFQLKNTSGDNASLEMILQKGPAILAFFKVSCPVCQLTAPFLERLGANNKVQVIGISQDDAKTTTEFVHRYNMTFPVLVDESKAGYPVSNGFGIFAVPSVFVVEADGRISSAFNGFSKRDLQALGDRVGVAPFRPDEKVPDFKAG